MSHGDMMKAFYRQPYLVIGESWNWKRVEDMMLESGLSRSGAEVAQKAIRRRQQAQPTPGTGSEGTRRQVPLSAINVRLLRRLFDEQAGSISDQSERSATEVIMRPTDPVDLKQYQDTLQAFADFLKEYRGPYKLSAQANATSATQSQADIRRRASRPQVSTSTNGIASGKRLRLANNTASNEPVEERAARPARATELPVRGTTSKPVHASASRVEAETHNSRSRNPTRTTGNDDGIRILQPHDTIPPDRVRIVVPRVELPAGYQEFTVEEVTPRRRPLPSVESSMDARMRAKRARRARNRRPYKNPSNQCPCCNIVVYQEWRARLGIRDDGWVPAESIGIMTCKRRRKLWPLHVREDRRRLWRLCCEIQASVGDSRDRHFYAPYAFQPDGRPFREYMDLPNMTFDASSWNERAFERAVTVEADSNASYRTPSILPSVRNSTPRRVVAGPGRIVAGPSRVIAGPSRVVAGPSRVVARPSRAVARPSQVVAGLGRVVGGPSRVEPEDTIMEDAEDECEGATKHESEHDSDNELHDAYLSDHGSNVEDDSGTYIDDGSDSSMDSDGYCDTITVASSPMPATPPAPTFPRQEIFHRNGKTWFELKEEDGRCVVVLDD